MITLGILLLVLPGIYLVFAYLFAPVLVAERGMGVWEAMEISREAVTHVWFRFAGLMVLLGVINMLGVITLGIAWIWTLPWSVMTYAILYNRLFGVSAAVLDN